MGGVICKKCGINKSLNSFNKDARRKSGFRTVCRDCTKKEHLNWRNRNQEHVRNRNKISYELFKERITYRYSRTKASAKQRGIDFDISFEYFVGIISQPCFYCGSNGQVGVDRIDSDLGYIMFNVAPSCYQCNVAKNVMSQQEFLSLCAKITKKHENN